MPVSDEHVARKYLQLLNSANDRVLKFNLSLVDVRKLLNQKRCFYTDVVLEPFDVKDPNKPNHRTFDRIDNSKGYVKGNVVACTYAINQYKGNMSIKEILRMQKTLTYLKNGITKNQIYHES